MAGELAGAVAGVVAAARFDRRGDAGVDATATGRAQRRDKGVLDEGVDERVPVGAAGGGSHQRGDGGGLEGVEDHCRVALGDGSEKVEIEVASDHRGQAQEPAGVVP